MSSQKLDVINNIIQRVEVNGSKCIDKLGAFKEKISDGVYKYEAVDANVTHFLIPLLSEPKTKTDFCEKFTIFVK